MSLTARPSCLVALTALLTAALPVAAQPDIDTGTPPTVPNWPIFALGRASTVSYASFGQSFVAPVGETRLDAFQFWLRDNTDTGNLPYHAYIFEWDPATRRTGTDYLFRSAAQDYTGAAVPTPFSFFTGGLDLVGGDSYIAVLSAVEFPNAPINFRPGIVVSTNWPDDVFTDGMSYVRFGPSGLGTLTSNPWNLAGGTGVDFAFTASFSPVGPTVAPEPTSVTLVATGALGVLMVARRRRRR
jgi:hypothetical protein